MGLEMEQKSLHGKRVPFPKRDMTRNGRWAVTVAVNNISNDYRSLEDHGTWERQSRSAPSGPLSDIRASLVIVIQIVERRAFCCVCLDP